MATSTRTRRADRTIDPRKILGEDEYLMRVMFARHYAAAIFDRAQCPVTMRSTRHVITDAGRELNMLRDCVYERLEGRAPDIIFGVRDLPGGSIAGSNPSEKKRVAQTAGKVVLLDALSAMKKVHEIFLMDYGWQIIPSVMDEAIRFRSALNLSRFEDRADTVKPRPQQRVTLQRVA